MSFTPLYRPQRPQGIMNFERPQGIMNFERPEPFNLLDYKFQEPIRRQTDASLTLAKKLISTEAKDKNLVFSPLSMNIVLGLVAAGSAGPTQDQLLKFLNSNSIEELNSLSSQLVTKLFTDGGPLGGPRLSFANGLWVDASLPLKPAFKDIVDNTYKAVSKPVDFRTKFLEALQEVNKWADKETNGLIQEILPPGSVDDLTSLVLANALYFKGTWNENFDASKTKKDEFFLSNGTSVQVPFMTSKKKQYISEFDGFKVLGLQYKQGSDQRRFSMYIYLPDNKDGLPSLVEKVNSGFIEGHLPQEKVEVGDFRIPKFKFDFGFEASNTLKGLGLELPFREGGLTEMVDSDLGKDLCVTSFFHKSCIEVNEEGTEAAAVSAAVIGSRGMCMSIPRKTDFVANHPFLFVIREDSTGVVFFVGQVVKPVFD